MQRRRFHDHDPISPTSPTAVEAPMPGLVLCPVPFAMLPPGPEPVLELYRLAYELARAAVAPSAYERALAVSLN